MTALSGIVRKTAINKSKYKKYYFYKNEMKMTDEE